MKEYADRNRRVQESTLKVGQTVLLKQEKRNKFSTRYDHRPFRVIAIKGTMVTAERAGVQRTRHISHFKPYNGPLPDDQLILVTSMKRRKREEIHDQSSSKIDVIQHVKDGVLIITSKGMADYDSLKAKGTNWKCKSNFDFLCSVYMMIFHDDFFCFA